jgi:hypothetical protein
MMNIPDMLLHLRHEIKEPGHLNSHQAAQDVKAFPYLATPLASQTAIAEANVRYGGLSKASFRRRVGAMVEYAACKIWFAAMRNETRYKRTTQLLRFVQVFGRRRKDGARILFVPGWSIFRDLPPVAPQSFRERWPEIERSTLDNEKQNRKTEV